MKEITSFKCDHCGKLFGNLQMCQRHEARHQFGALIGELGIGRGGEWSADMIADSLWDNAVKIIPLLQSKMEEDAA